MLLQDPFATRKEFAGTSKTFGIAVDATLFGGKHRTLGVICISATTCAWLPSSGTLGCGRWERHVTLGRHQTTGCHRSCSKTQLLHNTNSSSTKRHKLTKGMSRRETNIRCRRGESMKPTNHMRRLQGSARASALSSSLFSVSASPLFLRRSEHKTRERTRVLKN